MAFGLHGQGAGVVTGRYGTIGQVFFIECDFWPLNTTLYVRDFKGNDPRFISYFLRTFDFSAFSDKAAVPGINRNHLHEALVAIPDRYTQAGIATVLALLDDRIALLHETNATLEAIARALFKSWFVDFDPVRAKQQGAAPAGMDESTAALFPDSFEESQRRLIPKGWKVGSINDIAQIIYGAPFASNKFNSEGVGRPLVRIRDLRDESPGVYTLEVHPKGHVIKPGEIVVGMDGEFRAYLWGGEEAWLNQRVCVFSPKPGIAAAFLRLIVEPQLSHIEVTETATTVIHLGKSDIDRFVTLLPSEHVMAVFKDFADPLYARIVANKRTGRTLATLRDTLLPRLISGQLRLPEAEAALAET